MTPDNARATEPRDKPFPWRCPECGKRQVRPANIHHNAEIKHDGRVYSVAIPSLKVPRCEACGELVFDNDADSQIADALREQLALLSPGQIRQNREQLRLSQRDLAEHLGVAVETISRWENGVLIQSRAMDRYLRVYFGVPAARAALVANVATPSFGAHVQQ
ncbi:MAG: helix-turn-helix domain-containing protein [Planctomycetes bacterium]|nr:helix-turn-helix domain-containing protein [Planctomycetota bacterium]